MHKWLLQWKIFLLYLLNIERKERLRQLIHASPSSVQREKGCHQIPHIVFYKMSLLLLYCILMTMNRDLSVVVVAAHWCSSSGQYCLATCRGGADHSPGSCAQPSLTSSAPDPGCLPLLLPLLLLILLMTWSLPNQRELTSTKKINQLILRIFKSKYFSLVFPFCICISIYFAFSWLIIVLPQIFLVNVKIISINMSNFP